MGSFFLRVFSFCGEKKKGPTTWSNALLKKNQKFHQISRKISMKLSKKSFGYPNALVTYLSTHLGYQPTLHNCMYLYILSRAVLFIGRLFLRLKSFCGKWNTHYHWAKGVVKGSRLPTIFSSLWSETNVWMFCTAEQVPHCPYWCVRPTGAGYQCKSNWKLSHTMKEISTHESTIR